MIPNLPAIIFSAISIGLAFLFAPREIFGEFRYRAIAIWLLAIPLLAIFKDPLWLFVVIYVLFSVIAPFKADKRVVLFMLLIPALPLYVQAPLPFPGLNYLVTLNSYKVAVLALLLPLILMPRPENTPQQTWSVIDACVILYILYTTSQMTIEVGLTGGLRFLVDQCLVVAAPYFALSRIATRPEIVEDCLKTFIAAAVILAAISWVSTLKQWDFYRFAHFDPIAASAEVRGGFLRIQATLTTHSLAFHLSAAVLVLEYFKDRLNIGTLRLWSLRGMLLGGMYFTGSRGAIVGLAVAFGAYILLSMRSAGVRWALMIPAGIFALIAAYVLAFGNAAEYDAYGNFDYRKLLLTASLDYIADHALFGDVNFLESGRFDHLVQGQGIIDITNLYLQVALAYGLVGIVLFFMPFGLTILRLAALALNKREEHGAGMYAVVCGVLLGWLVLVATTSDVGLTLHLGLAFLALGHALAQRTVYMPVKRAVPVEAWL
jgi:hypothetical protein